MPSLHTIPALDPLTAFGARAKLLCRDAPKLMLRAQDRPNWRCGVEDHRRDELAWQADCYKVLLATGSKRETKLRYDEGGGFLRDAKTYFKIRSP